MGPQKTPPRVMEGFQNAATYKDDQELEGEGEGESFQVQGRERVCCVLGTEGSSVVEVSPKGVEVVAV